MTEQEMEAAEFMSFVCAVTFGVSIRPLIVIGPDWPKQWGWFGVPHVFCNWPIEPPHMTAEDAANQ